MMLKLLVFFVVHTTRTLSRGKICPVFFNVTWWQNKHSASKILQSTLRYKWETSFTLKITVKIMSTDIIMGSFYPVPMGHQLNPRHWIILLYLLWYLLLCEIWLQTVRMYPSPPPPLFFFNHCLFLIVNNMCFL